MIVRITSNLADLMTGKKHQTAVLNSPTTSDENDPDDYSTIELIAEQHDIGSIADHNETAHNLNY